MSVVTIRRNDDCEREAIHIPGAIQPHVALLCADPVDFRIMSASANLLTITGHPAANGDLLTDYLPVAALDAIRDALSRDVLLSSHLELSLAADWLPPLGGVTQIHIQDGVLCCEFERVTADDILLDGSLRLTQSLHEQMRDANSLVKLAQLTAETVRQITGMERVLVYRFDPDWNGEVIAESKAADWHESFLGFHFPAADIPSQARALYLIAPTRYCPDRDYQLVPLLATNADRQGRTFDLSRCHGRSHSQAHRVYQANLGVNGSMSASIINDGKLWGLIVGHHRAIHRVPTSIRPLVNMIASAFSMRLLSLEALDEKAARAAHADLLACLLEQIVEAEDFFTPLTKGLVKLTDLFSVNSGAALVGMTQSGVGGVLTVGETPPKEAILRLADYCREHQTNGVFASDHLSACVPEFELYTQTASGVLAVLAGHEEQNMFFWFRPESVSDRVWAGATPDHVGHQKASGNYLPRESFARWVAERRGHSLPWPQWTIDLARSLHTLLTEVTLRQMQALHQAKAELVEVTKKSAQVTAELTLKNRFVQMVTDNLPGLIAYWDSSLICKFANHTYQEWFGLPPEKIVGSQIQNLLGAALYSKNEPYIRGVLKGQKQIFERTIDKPSGEIGYTITQYIPDLDPLGKVHGFFVLVSDITTVKTAEATAQYADALMREIVTNAQSGICLYRADGPCVMVNAAAANLIGGTIELLQQQNFKTIASWRKSGMTEMALDVLKDRVSRSFELHLVSSFGKELWSNIRLSSLDFEGKQHLLLNIQDITEAKILEDELRHRADELAEAQSIAHLGNWSLEFTSGCLNWSDELYRMHGIVKGEVKLSYEYFLSFIHPDDRAMLVETFEQSLTARQPYELEFRIIRQSDCAIRWFHGRSIHQYDDYGQPLKTVGTTIDITDRKSAEFAQRTAAVAKASSRAKSAFLATMSHEIRSPMNSIVGFTRSLRRTIRNADEADKLAKIDQSAEHLLGIINDILDMSKIESGKMSLFPEHFMLSSLLLNISNQIKPILEQNGLALQMHVAADVPEHLLGDALRISQCLINYTSNAAKFTKNGSVKLRIHLEENLDDAVSIVPDGNFYLRFEVEDTGIGIAPEKLPHLFTPFTQAETGANRSYGGTGLGLALTKQFAELMGGNVGVESELGQGSRFWFTVRLQAASLADASPAAIPGAGSDALIQELARDFGKACILVAEDMPLNCEVVLDLLNDGGIKDVDFAQNGQSAVSMAKLRPYHLILMDMQMPVMDGLSATEAIRRIPEHRHTPILAMTANAFAEDRSTCLAAGMNDFLSKPVKTEAFYATLIKWLTHVQQRAAESSDAAASRAATSAENDIAILRDGLSASPDFDLEWELIAQPARYLRYLRMYAKSQLVWTTQLRAGLAAKDRENILRLAHTLKGTSAQLGIVGIAELTEGLEQAIKAGEKDAPLLILVDEIAHRLQTAGSVIEAIKLASDG